MHLVDEIIRDFREKGYIEELAVLPTLEEKFKRLQEITSQVNVFKGEIEDLSLDEQLYLDCKLQERGVDLGLCSNFNIFFSNKNNKFHLCCRRSDNSRTFCRGQKNKCNQ
ncbi:MAG: hypothetical protein WC564_02520 [Patescibacteria group bacterium]|jgi:hypothetical protein